MDITLNWGPVASGKYKKAKSLFKSGEYVKSARVLTKELAKKPNKYGYYALAHCLIALGDHKQAIKVLFAALDIDESYHEGLSLIGDIYVLLKDYGQAVGFYGPAVAKDPKNEEYKKKLASVFSVITFKDDNPNLKDVLIKGMEGHYRDMKSLVPAWAAIVKNATSVAPFFKLSKHKEYASFKKKMEGFDNCDGLIDPVFMSGLGKFIVADTVFENWLKLLRRYLLESVVEGKRLFTDENGVDQITCKLLRHCFLSDYIMSNTPEEEALLTALEERINEVGENPVLADLACYGCYKPLCVLPNSKDIAAQLEGEEHVSEIPKSQINGYWEQQDIKGGIEALVKVEDQTSRAVREQYEVFPYPRWEVASKNLFDPDMEGHLKGAKAKILVAGCGTGKEAAQLAYVFPDAQITAVDLSKASLSYAIYKTGQLGIDNIHFYHADIMALDGVADWQGRFDYIASGGVLHHMKDPKAGWKVLCGLLKDNGLMRIGLYSRHARWAINEARAAIKDKKIGSDSKSIRAFRDNISTDLEQKTVKRLMSARDFFNLSECRDLLFHVQEHQFDLLQVKEHLNDLGLVFLKLYLRDTDLEKYQGQYGEMDPAGRNLDFWDEWEKKYPDTFMGMYNFWCRKTD